MADKISNLDKEAMQSRLVKEFQKRINCIEKWEEKNPITVLILKKRLFISLKNVEHLFNNQKKLDQIKNDIKEGIQKMSAFDEEKEKIKEMEYFSNVLNILKFYDVPTPSKTLKVKNPKFQEESDSETQKEFIDVVIQEKRKYEMIDLENLSTESFLYRLQGLANRDDLSLEELVYKARVFENKGYQINLDNFLKITLILQRTKLRIPVICIGETGCGKTFMIKFISSVLMNVKEFHHETLHTGYTELELQEFIIDIVIRARKANEERLDIMNKANELKLLKYKDRGKNQLFKQNKKDELKNIKKMAFKSDEFWIFFDEFNTSVLQTYICEMMTERVSSLLPFDPKVIKNQIFIIKTNLS